MILNILYDKINYKEKSMIRIGIFGGAFNPPHNEHISALSHFKKEVNLTRCIIIPSYYPPHKNGADMLDFDHRKAMCSMAFPDDEISPIEKNSSLKNYALNTVRAIKESNPDGELFYLIGGDSMADFFTWYKPEELIREVTLVVYQREGREFESDEAIQKVISLGGKVIKLDSIGQNISSTEIRYLISLGADLRGYMPSDIINYIIKNGFYKSDIVEYARSYMTERTFNHAVRTAIWALELNRKIGLSPKLVFESALLHDIEKDSNSTQGVPKDAVGHAVMHQYSGAYKAKELGLSDEVVSAIKYHTTAKAKMSLLEMLVYSADMTEPARSFSGVDLLRMSLSKDLKQGFVDCLTHSYEYLIGKQKEIYYLTKEAYDFYHK